MRKIVKKAAGQKLGKTGKTELIAKKKYLHFIAICASSRYEKLRIALK